MTRPKTPYEAASYDLNKFRERRMAERRSIPRDTADRRVHQVDDKTMRTGDGQTAGTEVPRD